MNATVFLARHGRTAWNASGRYLGNSDPDLDDVGTAQAAALAEWSAGAELSGVLSSPATRALRTAGAAAERAGVPLRTDERLRELDFGIAEGRTLDELRETRPDVVRDFELDADIHHFPEGERPAAAATRARAAVEAAVTSRGARMLVVGHNTLLRLLLCDLLGIPLGSYRRALPRLDHGAYTELSFRNASWGLQRLNVPLAAAAAR